MVSMCLLFDVDRTLLAVRHATEPAEPPGSSILYASTFMSHSRGLAGGWLMLPTIEWIQDGVVLTKVSGAGLQE